MSNFDPDSPSENDWDECGDLAWNEFDWEQYLRLQDDVIHRYLAFYEQLQGHPDRIDETARFMGWDEDAWNSDTPVSSDEAETEQPEIERPESEEYDAEPYTLHKNPVFIATKAIYLSLKRSWERVAADNAKVPQPLALVLQTSLHRGEEHAILAIQALDFGDFAMAISLFKRALGELNRSLSFIDERTAEYSRFLLQFRQDAVPRLFDLREIWLRIMNECRDELQRPVEGDDSES